MQLQRAFARAATVEEFSTYSSSSVPSETKKTENRKYLHAAVCHRRGGILQNGDFSQASPWHWLQQRQPGTTFS